MLFEPLLVDNVVIFNLVSGGTTRFGDSVPAYDAGTAAKARVQQLPPLAGAEETEARDTRTTRFTVYLLPTAVISGTSHITWEGKTLLIEGEPAIHKDQSGAHHIECNAKEVRG